MIRRGFHIAFVVLVPLAVMLIAGRSIVTKDKWAKRRLHELLTIQAAQTLNAEVRVGAIEGHILTGLKILDLAISEGTSLAESTLVSVDEIHLDYDLWPVLRREIPPIECVNEVRIVGLRGKLSRDAAGKLNIQRFLDLRKPGKGPPTARFKGRIVVEDARVSYTDRAETPELLRDLDLLIGGINATADFARPETIEYDIAAEGLRAPFERLEADGRVGLADQSVSAHGTLIGVRIPPLYQRFAANPALDVVAGVASAEINACFIPGELVHYAVIGHVHQLVADVAALRGERVVASGDFTATPAGVSLPHVTLAALGSQIVGSGALFDLSSPAVDIEATARNVDLKRWAAVAPEVAEALPEIGGAKAVRVAARVAGPVSSPDIRVAAEFPGQVTVTYPIPGEPEAQEAPTEATVLRAAGLGLSMAAAVPDIQTRDVKAQLHAVELSIDDLGALLPEQDYLRQLAVDPLRNVSAEFVYSSEAPATAGRLAIDRVQTEHGPVEGLDVDYALVDQTLRARASAESLLGAGVSAEGVVDFSESPVSIYAEFDADRIDVAKVAAIADLGDVDLSGDLSASGVAAIEGDDIEAATQVAGRRLAFEGIEVDQAVANVGITRDAADVQYLTATSPLGTLWATAQVPFDGPIEAELAAAGIPLEQVQGIIEEHKQEDPQSPEDPEGAQPPDQLRLTGTAFAHGWVRGELKSPEIKADLAAFEVGANQWTAPVFTASMAGDPQNLRVTNALVRRGTAVASAEVSLSEIAWPPGSFFSDEEPPPEGSEEEPPPFDGELDGSVRVAGFDLSQLAEFVSLPDGLLLTGLVEPRQLGITGTLQAPRLEGPVSLSHAKVALVDQDIAVGPLALDADLLANREAVVVRHASVTSSAGELELAAELDGWGTDEGMQLSATFSARELPIGSYAPAEGIPGRIGGTIDSIGGTVSGPLAEPWPDVSAEVKADQVQLGRRKIRGLTATLTHDSEHRTLQATKVQCEAADGEIAVRAASYRPEDGKLFADAKVTDLDAQELLFWVADLASYGQEGEAAVEARERLLSVAHRLRGRISADKLMVGGYLSDLSGKVKGLRTQAASVDRKSLPDVQVACQFEGLAPVPAADLDVPGDADEASPFTHLRVDNIAVKSTVEEGELTAGGSVHWDGDVDLTAQANLIPARALKPWLPGGIELDGKIAVTAQATGSASDPQIRASVDVLEPTLAGLDFDLLEATRIDVTPDAIVMLGGKLKRGAHEVTLAGQLPFDRQSLRFNAGGPVSFDAYLSDLPLQTLLELTDGLTTRGAEPTGGSSFCRQCEADGLLTASLNVSGRLAEPELRGYLSVDRGATFRLQSWPEKSIMEDIWFDAVLGPSPTGIGSMIETLNCSARLDKTVFDVKEGRLELSHLSPEQLLDNRIDNITLTVKADEQKLPGGTLAKSIDAAVRVFTGPTGWHVVKIDKASAQLGRGEARLTGSALIDTLRLDEFGHVPCDLRLEMEDARISYKPIVENARVNGVIAARKFASRTARPLPAWFLEDQPPDAPSDPAAAIRIVSLPIDRDSGRGRITVTRAAIGLPARKKAGDEEVEQLLPPGPGEQFVIYGLPNTFPAPEIDVSVAIGSGVRLSTPVVQADVIPDPEAIRITGTPQAPRLEAGAALRRGELRLPRGNLNIPEANAAVAIHPPLWLLDGKALRRQLEITGNVFARAEGKVTGVVGEGRPAVPIQIKLELSGRLPPKRLTDLVQVSSLPPLSTQEIYKLLALGPVGAGDKVAAAPLTAAQEMLAELVAKNILEGVLEPLEQELTEALGLEEFEVIVGLDEAVELRVGKYIVENLLLSYHRTAGAPEDQFDLRLSYNVKDQYQVTYQTDERARQQVNLEYRWEF